MAPNLTFVWAGSIGAFGGRYALPRAEESRPAVTAGRRKPFSKPAILHRVSNRVLWRCFEENFSHRSDDEYPPAKERRPGSGPRQDRSHRGQGHRRDGVAHDGLDPAPK